MSNEDQMKAKAIGAIAEGGRLCSPGVQRALVLLAARGISFMEQDGYTYEGIKPLMEEGADLFDYRQRTQGIEAACNGLTPLALQIEREWAARGRP